MIGRGKGCILENQKAYIKMERDAKVDHNFFGRKQIKRSGSSVTWRPLASKV
jgi:hypothetical protein